MLVVVESVISKEFQEFWGLPKDPVLGHTFQESSELPPPLLYESTIIVDQHIHQRFIWDWWYNTTWVTSLKLLQ